MDRLAQRDIGRLAHFLHNLYAQRRVETFAAFINDAVPALVSSEFTATFHIEGRPDAIDRRPDTIRLVTDPPMNAVVQDGERVFVAHFIEHPLTQPPHKLSDARVLRLSDAVPVAEWHRLGMYNEFFRPARIEHEIGFLFTPHPHAICDGLVLNRGGQDFSGRDRALLEAVRPHIAQAFANARSYSRLANVLSTSSQAIQALGVDLIALDGDTRVQFSKGNAWPRLWRYFGPRLRGHDRIGDLPDALRQWVMQQLARLRTHDDAPPPIAPLLVEREDRRLVIRLQLRPDHRQSLLVLEEQVRPPLAETLQALGLTPRQAEIATLVIDGLTNQEIARELSISPLTVRTHLEHIYDRLGVQSRAELVQRALRHDDWIPAPVETDPTPGAPDIIAFVEPEWTFEP